MKKIIYLNSGHSKIDPGSIQQGLNESDINMEIRDLVTPKLRANGFSVVEVPDDLNLADSIAWINERALDINDGLALSLHCNCCNSSGAETYYYGSNAKSKAIAQALLDGYLAETGLKSSNGGVRSDTTGRFGELGWIRKTNVWATLIEMIYLDNPEDVKFLNENKDKVANGICRGVCNIFCVPFKYPSVETPEKSREDIKQEIIELVKQL